MERKLTTILAMDVAGSGTHVERDGEAAIRRLRTIRSTVVDPAIARHDGRMIMLAGERAIVAFPSVLGAVQCAVSIQREIAAGSGPHGISLRMGIHLDDLIFSGDDIRGDGVDVAARLESIAPAGGIVLSKQVHDCIAASLPVDAVPIGGQAVGNLGPPVEAYRIAPPADAPPANVIRFGDFELDEAQFELRHAGSRVAIEPQVFNLLVFLTRNRERTVTKDEIFREIWGGRAVSEAALSSQIKAARRALGDSGASQHMIRTVHGRGFRFLAPVEPAPPPRVPFGGEVTAGRALEAIATRPCVAVLPFANLSRDPDEDYIADGITEDITTALSKYRWLNVIARNPAFAFRRSGDGIRAIGLKLGAGYIVVGSVRKAGTRARITVQIVDAETELSVWSERFDRDVVDIFELQDDIAAMVAARIEAELGLTEQQKAVRRPRKNLGAWDLYQLGLSEFYRFTREANLTCQDLLRRALDIDPAFAAAHSRLAYAIVLGMVYFDERPDEGLLDDALRAARRAIELDDQDANGYFTLGRVHLARRKYEQAIDALEHAVELNPCLAQTYCGLGDSLAYEGRLDEAIEQFDIAIRLSPHDPFRWGFYSYRALAHLFRGEFAEAVLWARRAVQVPNAHYWARAHLVAALGHLGDDRQARTAIRDLLEAKPGFTVAFAREHLFYLKRADQMERYIAGLRKAGLD